MSTITHGLTGASLNHVSIFLSLSLMPLLPGKVGLDESFLILENLATLRSELVQSLLIMCRSIKVKRPFVFMIKS